MARYKFYIVLYCIVLCWNPWPRDSSRTVWHVLGFDIGF